MTDIAECWDCGEPFPSEIRQARLPISDNEKVDIVGDEVEGLIICPECWGNVPEFLRFPLNVDQEKIS